MYEMNAAQIVNNLSGSKATRLEGEGVRLKALMMASFISLLSETDIFETFRNFLRSFVGPI